MTTRANMCTERTKHPPPGGTEKEENTMKYSEMNYRQKKAYANIYHALNWLLGGLENTLQDYDEESEEYREAKAQLDDHAGLVETVYDMASTDIYGPGSCYFGAGARSFLRDIRFCGREWLMERCERWIRKEGY